MHSLRLKRLFLYERQGTYVILGRKYYPVAIVRKGYREGEMRVTIKG